MEVFNYSGTLSALQEATTLLEETLSRRPPGHPSRARSCRNLGGAFRMRHAQEGNLAFLQRALPLQQEALQLSEAEPLGRAEAQCNLASTLAALDIASGSYASEEQCIALFRQALDVFPEKSFSRVTAYGGLLDQLRRRFARTSEVPTLNEAIGYGREAVSITSAHLQHRWVAYTSLAQALRARFELLTQTADLDEAISLQRVVLSLIPPTHPYRITPCVTLASLLYLELSFTGDKDRLDEAISLQHEAYILCPESRPEYAWVCENYASHLVHLFYATRNISVLDKAIELCRESLSLRGTEHEHRSASLNNLGAHLATRFHYFGYLACLDEAVPLLREALVLRPPGHAHRGESCYNLGRRLLDQVVHTKDTTHLEESVILCKEICGDDGSRGPRYPLGYLCLSVAYLVPDTPFFDTRAAATALRTASENIRETNVIVELSTLLGSLDLPLIPASYMHDLLGAFSNVISSLPRLSNSTLSLQRRLQMLKDIKNVGAASLRCAILAGDLLTGVELMERSRAVFWSQALNTRDPQLESLPNDLRVEISRLLQVLSTLPSILEDNQLTARDMMHRHYERLQTLIETARQLPGLASFMLGAPYDTLSRTFANTAVVMFSADMGGCRAIIVAGAQAEPVHLLLDQLSVNDLENLSASLAGLGMRLGSTGVSPGARDEERGVNSSRRQKGGSQVEQLLSKVWVKTMKPVLNALEYRTVCAFEPGRQHDLT
jgi:tetratricopeptide (TPR) repeat protein